MLQYSKYDTTPLSNLRALRVRVGQTSFSLLSSDGILKTMSEDKLVYFLYLISFTSGTYSNFSSTETFLYGIKYSNSTTLVKHDYHFFYAAENYGLVQIVARQR